MSAKGMKINGLGVRDAKKAVVLHITANDIKRGKVKAPTKCAAALCCLRQLHATEARVHIARTYLRFNGHWKRYLTSKALRSEIVSFDRGGTFEPGNYVLHKMQPSRQDDGTRDGKAAKRPKKRRGLRHTLTGVRPMGLTA